MSTALHPSTIKTYFHVTQLKETFFPLSFDCTELNFATYLLILLHLMF